MFGKILPGYHRITGCDTTYSYGVGKVRSFKKMVRENKSHLLSNQRSTSTANMDLCEIVRFFQSVLHTEKKGINYC